MAISVNAIYENGVLKPTEPLPWRDGQRVVVSVSSFDSPLLAAYGLMNYRGTVEEAEYYALDPELMLEESP